MDGNDVEAVYDAARLAVARARSGAGPSFLECRTFRWRGHVGASTDEDVGVRRRGELAEWLLRDPLKRAEERLGRSRLLITRRGRPGNSSCALACRAQRACAGAATPGEHVCAS